MWNGNATNSGTTSYDMVQQWSNGTTTMGLCNDGTTGQQLLQGASNAIMVQRYEK